ncbi:hypothetical protein [Streptomyces sp. TS71-3]|uniref:hypothetical protein n=1 Tax=Streptomyces sp. TS71-3 TaxID=2733862 RepID=UPI001B001214|nr:hypothetical protein [Streptomyces sp. TS71-3]GHJ42657.1 hypothetical protein Sm713_82660 [Streptomyces sp. TS71-3]
MDIAHVFVEALTGMRLLSLAVEWADLDPRLCRLWDALLRMVLAEGSTFSLRPPREVPAACPPGRPEDGPGTPGTTPGKHDRPEARALRNKIAENGRCRCQH